MDKSERLKKIKEKYTEMKESGQLQQRTKRTQNPMDAFNRDYTDEILKTHIKDGKTVVPIDLKDFAEKNNYNTDFSHTKDRIRRYFEIVLLNQLHPEEMQNLHGLYGKETTETIRKYFKIGKHFVIESNADTQDAFLSIDISDLITA